MWRMTMTFLVILYFFVKKIQKTLALYWFFPFFCGKNR